jgi:hypothetical protein
MSKYMKFDPRDIGIWTHQSGKSVIAINSDGTLTIGPQPDCAFFVSPNNDIVYFSNEGFRSGLYHTNSGRPTWALAHIKHIALYVEDFLEFLSDATDTESR